MRETKILLLLLVVLTLGGCRREAEVYRVGVSQCLDDAWRRKMNDEMQRELLFHSGIELETRTANGSNELQSAQIDSFIAEGINLLIVSPNEAEAVKPAVSRAFRAGVPVIIADRRVTGEEWTAFIGGDNYQVGQLLAKWLVRLSLEQDKDLRVLEILGLPGSTPTVYRHEGLADGIAGSRVEIVAQGIGEWFTEPSADVTDSLLRLHPEVNVIVAQNDLMARGARMAAQAQARDVYILGVDAMSGEGGGVEAVHDGIINASATYASRGDLIIQRVEEIRGGLPFVRDTVLQTALIDAETAGLMMLVSNELDHEIGSVRQLQSRLKLLTDQYQTERWLVVILTILIVVLVVLAVVVYWVVRYRHRMKAERERSDRMLAHQQKQLEAITEELARTKAAKADEDKFVDKLKHEIEIRMNDSSLDVEGLSRELGLSRAALYRKTKMVTGQSPVELIRHVRLSKAQKMLRETDMSVQQIAYEVGFSSPSYFTKCYKEYFGIVPQEENRPKMV